VTRRGAVLACALALGAGTALTGCGTDGGTKAAAGPELTVSGAYMPQPVGDLAAGFLTVRNEGGAPDRLTSVTSAVSDDITIHESKGQRMLKVSAFEVPADGSLALERGGNHIMFAGLKQPVKQGAKVPVELHFERSGPIRVELLVKEATYNPAAGSTGGSGGSGTPDDSSGHASKHH
jgi:periplasmic copper chaperone A